MINRLLQSFFINEQDSLLTKEQEAAIVRDIENINLKRMELLLFILLIIEILFIGFVDIPNLRNNATNVTWTDKRYFILHLSLSIISVLGIIFAKILLMNDKSKLKKFFNLIIHGITMAILVLISLINGLDQIKIGHTSSVFVATMLICGAIIMIKFPASLLVYSIPFSTFIGGLLVFQKDAALLNSNIINGLVYYIAVIFISKGVYDSQFNQLSKNVILKEVNNKLDYMSNHDPLTGLPNRRHFETQAKQKMDIMNQHGEEAALLLIDIDHFKNINDEFGHPVGDTVLKEVSDILRKNIKDTDLVTRWGGEEFIILLFQTSIQKACKTADKIRMAVQEKPIMADSFTVNITASFGVAQLKGSFLNSFEVSYKLADKALYQVKNQGRNQVVVAYLSQEDN